MTLSFYHIPSVIPPQIRQWLRAIHRKRAFGRALRRFMMNPYGHTHPGDWTLKELIYGWGNEGWSAWDEYLASCIMHSRSAYGPILECGSGLSTILMGICAKKNGQKLWALEHKPEWARKVSYYLRRYEIDSVTLCVTPLKNYGEYEWYDPPLSSMPDAFSLVLCDGPPSMTKGGRYGLGPIMKGKLMAGCIILLDDAERKEELAIANVWKTEMRASMDVTGIEKPYIKLIVGQKP